MTASILQPQRPAKYVETSVSRSIKNAAAFAVRTRGAVLARGPAGIGKSSALADILKHDDKARAFEVTQNGKTTKRILEGVAAAFRIHHSRAFGSDLMDVLSDWIPGLADDGTYLMVDEVQNAGLAGVRLLLTLNEHYGIPLVLSGNPAAIKITRANAAVFEQIDDRFVKTVDLDPPAPADIQLIAIEHGVEGADAYRVVARYGAETSIRRVVKLLEIARGIAGLDGSIRVDHVRTAVTYIHEGQSQFLQVLRSAS